MRGSPSCLLPLAFLSSLCLGVCVVPSRTRHNWQSVMCPNGVLFVWSAQEYLERARVMGIAGDRSGGVAASCASCPHVGGGAQEA